MSGEWMWIIGLCLAIVCAAGAYRLNWTGIVIASLIGGIVISLLTMRPLSWIIQLVLPPEYSPWRVDMTALLLDVIAWSLLVLIISGTINRQAEKRPRNRSAFSKSK